MDETRPLYANVVEAAAGPFDVTLDFGYKSPERLGTTEYELVARIAMSMTHLKTMTQVMQRVVEEYEKELGTIPVPTEMLPTEEEAKEEDHGERDTAGDPGSG